MDQEAGRRRRLGRTYASRGVAGKPALHRPWGQPGPRGGLPRKSCAQLGDRPVEPGAGVAFRPPMTCANTTPPVWTQNSSGRCPFTGRSLAGRRVALSTKGSERPRALLLHSIVHRCVWTSTVMPCSGSAPLTVTSHRASGGRAVAARTGLAAAAGRPTLGVGRGTAPHGSVSRRGCGESRISPTSG
jgi:hypothetical protein